MIFLRRCLRGWGMLTARWRLRPSFVIVGAQRGGTTTLYRVLSEHPALARPTVAKGIGYFDLRYANGPRWYAGQFPLACPHGASTGPTPPPSRAAATTCSTRWPPAGSRRTCRTRASS